MADGIASRRNPKHRNTSFESTKRVRSQDGVYCTYNPRMATPNQVDKLMARAAPTFPILHLNTRTQQRGICTQRVAVELKSIGRTKLWDWRNFINGRRIALPNSHGILHIAYLPAWDEISGSWPTKQSSFRIKTHKRDIGRETSRRQNMALCVCRPRFWYCCAPKAWPHRVSSAVAIPDCMSCRSFN